MRGIGFRAGGAQQFFRRYLSIGDRTQHLLRGDWLRGRSEQGDSITEVGKVVVIFAVEITARFDASCVRQLAQFFLGDAQLPANLLLWSEAGQPPVKAQQPGSTPQ